MKVAFGNRELELGGPHLGELRNSTALMGDVEALRRRMDEDGYLLLRGLHDRQTVLAARRRILQFMSDEGDAVDVSRGDLMEGRINPAGRCPNMMGRKGVTHTPEVLAVVEGDPIMRFFDDFLEEPALTFSYKWLRAVGQGNFTGSHYDVVYMGRGSKRLYTGWTPMGDVPIDQGALSICVGSHNLPEFEKLRRTYGHVDVDRDRVDGWFSTDPLDVVQNLGGRWATTDFEVGDALIFTMYTLHGSTNNTTDRWRISSDTRYQPAGDPADERWNGDKPKAHYTRTEEPNSFTDVQTLRKEWGL